jgi:NADH dehydrogenase FAD-containing subunit
MARRLTLEGAKVEVVAEIMPYSGGLKRNIVQCLDDFGIPLKLSHTVTEIRGRDRIEGVTISAVDEKMQPIPGTEEYYECDTLLLSVGLIPENELSSGLGVSLDRITNGPVTNESLETNIPGVFACGNVLHVHDLVDYVSEEAGTAGENAARYIKSGCIESSGKEIPITVGDGVRYTVPRTVNPERVDKFLTVRFRVSNNYRNKRICVKAGDREILSKPKNIFAPGEMETIMLKKSDLLDTEQIKVSLEDKI